MSVSIDCTWGGTGHIREVDGADSKLATQGYLGVDRNCDELPRSVAT